MNFPHRPLSISIPFYHKNQIIKIFMSNLNIHRRLHRIISLIWWWIFHIDPFSYDKNLIRKIFMANPNICRKNCIFYWKCDVMFLITFGSLASLNSSKTIFYRRWLQKYFLQINCIVHCKNPCKLDVKDWSQR